MAGDIGFDPLQISDLVPLQWSREAELKHARVCMRRADTMEEAPEALPPNMRQ